MLLYMPIMLCLYHQQISGLLLRAWLLTQAHAPCVAVVKSTWFGSWTMSHPDSTNQIIGNSLSSQSPYCLMVPLILFQQGSTVPALQESNLTQAHGFGVVSSVHCCFCFSFVLFCFASILAVFWFCRAQGLLWGSVSACCFSACFPPLFFLEEQSPCGPLNDFALL